MRYGRRARVALAAGVAVVALATGACGEDEEPLLGDEGDGAGGEGQVVDDEGFAPGDETPNDEVEE